MLVRIADGIDFVPISDNEVLVQFGTRSFPSELLRDTDLTGILGKLTRTLTNGAVCVNDLLVNMQAEEQAEARSLICDLLQRGFLTEARKSSIDQYLAYTFTGKSQLEQRTVSL